MISNHAIPGESGDTFTSQLHVRCLAMEHLRVSVDPNLDGIKAIADRQRANEIHRYYLPRPFGDLVRVKLALLVPAHSSPSASLADLYIFGDLVSQPRPPIITLHHFLRAVLSGMAEHRQVVMKSDNLIAQLLIPGYIYKSVVIYNIVLLFPGW